MVKVSGQNYTLKNTTNLEHIINFNNNCIF